MTSKEALEGAQKLIRMWEAGRLDDDMTLAMLELHLEREATLAPLLPESIAQGIETALEKAFS